METESTSEFLQYRQGRNVFRFLCPVCGCDGEFGVLAGHSRNGLVACPDGCGAYFIVRRARGLFAKPSLEFALGPAHGSARLEEASLRKEDNMETETKTQQAIRARRPVLYEKLLRAKLAAIRDEAMELQAALEFVHGGDALADPVWQFADRTVRHAEEIMANTRGELSLPE